MQTQILGISSGITITDENCERIKLSRSLYAMGMKVAAVSALCQDARVFDAMMMAGTPCPYKGKKVEEHIEKEKKLQLAERERKRLSNREKQRKRKKLNKK